MVNTTYSAHQALQRALATASLVHPEGVWGVTHHMIPTFLHICECEKLRLSKNWSPVTLVAPGKTPRTPEHA